MTLLMKIKEWSNMTQNLTMQTIKIHKCQNTTIKIMKKEVGRVVHVCIPGT